MKPGRVHFVLKTQLLQHAGKTLLHIKNKEYEKREYGNTGLNFSQNLPCGPLTTHLERRRLHSQNLYLHIDDAFFLTVIFF